ICLEFKDVTLRYKKRIILENINFNAAAGEIIAVVGHNGAGKTTFSRGLCGLYKKSTGQFLLNGRQESHKARRKRSYMVMQDVNYELFAESVETECTFGLHNPNQALVEQTLSELELLPYRKRHPNTLSGGQKQRVAVAVSMMCEKELLVLDEPTSGLDYDSMSQVADLVEKLSGMGKIIFVVTHDYELICRVCTRILHLDEGEMPEDLAVSTENEDKIRALFGMDYTTAEKS
ncbi:MAG: ATP-binding cassette domain-containing protein, partial [Synergistaceae bacterium]|nr:ATP-binding cassette domain-containing protein [Synergistaceae bacterium]